MSAVAPAAEYADVTPRLEVVAPSAAQLAEKEMYRWMLWFGLPALVAAFFVAALFATGQDWLIAPAIAAVIADIMALIWLAMSSDTNSAA
jgi:predicted permease